VSDLLKFNLAAPRGERERMDASLSGCVYAQHPFSRSTILPARACVLVIPESVTRNAREVRREIKGDNWKVGDGELCTRFLLELDSISIPPRSDSGSTLSRTTDD